jgi:hypothetical protein
MRELLLDRCPRRLVERVARSEADAHSEKRRGPECRGPSTVPRGQEDSLMHQNATAEAQQTLGHAERVRIDPDQEDANVGEAIRHVRLS